MQGSRNRHQLRALQGRLCDAPAILVIRIPRGVSVTCPQSWTFKTARANQSVARANSARNIPRPSLRLLCFTLPSAPYQFNMLCRPSDSPARRISLRRRGQRQPYVAKNICVGHAGMFAFTVASTIPSPADPRRRSENEPAANRQPRSTRDLTRVHAFAPGQKNDSVFPLRRNRRCLPNSRKVAFKRQPNAIDPRLRRQSDSATIESMRGDENLVVTRFAVVAGCGSSFQNFSLPGGVLWTWIK